MEMNVRDVAKMLQVSEKTIYRWLGQGRIPAYRLNDQYRFDRGELLQWMVAQKLNAPGDIIETEQPATGPMTPPSLAQAIEQGGIFYRVGGSNRQEVLREAVSLLRFGAQVEGDQFYRALVARENLASTAIGHGIAVPHSRQPLDLQLGTPMLALCFLEQPIYYAALDGEPVHTLFVLAAPGLRDHLALLQRLVFALRDESLRLLLAQQSLRQEIMDTFREIDIRLDQQAREAAKA